MHLLPLHAQKIYLIQVDLMVSEVDEIDRSNLACIFGRNPEGTAPVQPPIPRMRELLDASDHLIALVDHPDKVFAILKLLAALGMNH